MYRENTKKTLEIAGDISADPVATGDLMDLILGQHIQASTLTLARSALLSGSSGDGTASMPFENLDKFIWGKDNYGMGSVGLCTS
jgi:hypothetical protein